MTCAAFGELRVAYREIGEGPPLVLVHGLMTASYSWRYVIAKLAAKHRVIALDLRGAGDTTAAPDRAHSPAALASFVAAFLRALGLEGSVVVGNSLGGYVCLHLALAEPGLMRALVDIHSPAIPAARYYAMRGARRARRRARARRVHPA